MFTNLPPMQSHVIYIHCDALVFPCIYATRSSMNLLLLPVLCQIPVSPRTVSHRSLPHLRQWKDITSQMYNITEGKRQFLFVSSEQICPVIFSLRNRQPPSRPVPFFHLLGIGGASVIGQSSQKGLGTVVLRMLGCGRSYRRSVNIRSIQKPQLKEKDGCMDVSMTSNMNIYCPMFSKIKDAS